MRIRDGFLLREIVGTYVVIPVGNNVSEFKGLMTLSESGAFIWKTLSENLTYDELLSKILDRYEVDETTARADLDGFLASARECNALLV